MPLLQGRGGCIIHIDFESRSKADIWECGAWVYSTHPTTEILCLAYRFDDGPIQLITWDELVCCQNVPLNDVHDELFMRIREGEPLSAFNALFEQCMWNNICVPLYGWPRIPIKQWRCVMAKALAYSLPQSLEKCGEALQVEFKKDAAGKKVMLKLAKPQTNGEFYENGKDLERLYDYCRDDVLAECEIDHKIPDLIPSEQAIWFLDQLINQRGVFMDREAIEAAIAYISTQTAESLGVVKEATGGYLDGISRRQRTLGWVHNQGVALSDYTKLGVAAVLEDPTLPPEVRQVLEIKLSLGKTSLKKYPTMLNAMSDDDDRIRDTLIYHGASTGRWTGKLVQFHNLPKGSGVNTDQAVEILKMGDFNFFRELYPNVLDTLSACIRRMIIAPPGHDLLVADYNAIEARVVMWLAGEVEGLTKFAKGEDLYVDMARSIYQKNTITKTERNLGKTAVLGCGYGMGPAKFRATCAGQNIHIDEDFAKKVVSAYREKYSSIKNYWYAAEAAAVNAVLSQKAVDHGKVRWFVRDRFLFCRLPSGRCLVYNNPRVDKVDSPWGLKDGLFFYGVNSTTKKWEEQTTYGGQLTENITQAVARDLLAEAMFRCEKAGYRVIFSVHDEIVCEVGEGYGSVEAYNQILSERPIWATGCPVKAEGWRGKRYRK